MENTETENIFLNIMKLVKASQYLLYSQDFLKLDYSATGTWKPSAVMMPLHSWILHIYSHENLLEGS